MGPHYGRWIITLLIAAVIGGVYWFLSTEQKDWIAATVSDWSERARRWVNPEYAERMAAAEAEAEAQAAAQRERDEKVAELSRQGIAAAERGELDLAVEYFQEARQIAPQSPAVLLNIALAYDMGGKWDAAAISCYRAYLAAAPEAQNVDPVRSRIAALEAQIEKRVLKMVEAGTDAAGELPPGSYADSVYADLASALVLIGHSTPARSIAAYMKVVSENGAARCHEAIADAEAKIAKAMRTISSSDPYDAAREIADWMANLEVHPYKQDWVIDPPRYVESLKTKDHWGQVLNLALSAEAHALVHLELRRQEHEWAQRRPKFQ